MQISLINVYIMYTNLLRVESINGKYPLFLSICMYVYIYIYMRVYVLIMYCNEI